MLMIFGPGTDISIAFNYGQAMGSGQLLRFVTEHTEVRRWMMVNAYS